MYSDSYIIYRFFASSRTTYKVTWTNGDGALMYVSAGTSSSNPTGEFSNRTTSGQQIYLYSSSYVYIKIMPTDEKHTGSFTISVTANPYTGSYGVVLTEYTTYGGTAPSQGSDTTDSSSSSSDSSSEKTTSVSVSTYFSSGYTDFQKAYVSSASTPTFSFTVENGYVYYIQTRDNDTWTEWFTTNDSSVTPTDAQFVLSDANGTTVKTLDDSDVHYIQPSVTGTWTIKTILASKSSSAGTVAFRIYRRATSSFSPSKGMSVQSADSSVASGFIKAEISAEQTYDYAISLAAGTTYVFHWLDYDIQSSILSSYTLTDGILAVYDKTGEFQGWIDSIEYPTFTPETSGTYTISIQTWDSTTPAGYVGLRVYKQ